MRALRLREVNLLDGGIREEQADECIAEDGGDFVDGLIERGVAIAHERSPLETTHDDLRLAVEPASGGCDQRGLVAAFVNYIRRAGASRPGRVWTIWAAPLTNSCFSCGDGEKWPWANVTEAHGCGFRRDATRNGETRKCPNYGQLRSLGGREALTNGLGKVLKNSLAPQTQRSS